MSNSKNKLVSIVIVTYNRKKQLKACIESFLDSSYKPFEIIVVDNASKPPVFTYLPKNPKIKLITSEFNLGAAEGRNRGLAESKGDYVLFTDDDAVCDREMVAHLISVFESQKDAGLVQPLIYDKKRQNILQGAGHDISLLSGKIKAWGVSETDRGQYDGLREVPMCGCVWMVKRKVFQVIGNYDRDYFIPYEDSDFSIRARKAGFKLYCYSKAKSWHEGVKNPSIHPWLKWLGITTAERGYRLIRNKMIFIRKHAPLRESVIFFFAILPSYLVVHTIIIIFARRLDILLMYYGGFISGTYYSITAPIRNRFIAFYRQIDQNLNPIKMVLIAQTDPLTWVIDTSAETILDLGCGQGKPMELLKSKMRITRSVGVDLFGTYLEEAKKHKIHNEYIMKDIRKLKFPNKSFDIVLASHVLEHLTKEDAWRLLSKMEKWAKKQIIIATPIGKHYHAIEDGNVLQFHRCFFTPEEFEKRGYQVKRYGWKWLLGENGMVHYIKNDLIRKLLYTFNILLTPIYYLFQQNCDYIFIAHKRYQDG